MGIRITCPNPEAVINYLVEQKKKQAREIKQGFAASIRGAFNTLMMEVAMCSNGEPNTIYDARTASLEETHALFHLAEIFTVEETETQVIITAPKNHSFTDATVATLRRALSFVESEVRSISGKQISFGW